MPNWCAGDVIVRGNAKDVEEFCRHFVFREDEGASDDGRKFFARSFAETSWKDFKRDHLGKEETRFAINFAWSAHSCLIDGYPQEMDDAITLEQACKDHKVDVIIDTEEPGIGFEEHIECIDGKLTCTDKEMRIYTCECGYRQAIPSSYNINEEECMECEKVGLWH